MAAYVVMGATGQTGGATARALKEKAAVRVVVRSAEKGEAWRKQGAEVAVIGDATDVDALAKAFQGAEGAYVLNPPDYASSDMFARAEKVSAAIAEAARSSGLPKLVALSSVGSHLPEGTGNIRTTYILEQTLRTLDIPVGFVRAASFLDNYKGLVPVAQQSGVLPSFYAPLDCALPMVASEDIGAACADALMSEWTGTKIWNLHGPQEYSPNQIAEAFAAALHRPVQAVPVGESEWPQRIAQMGNSPAAVSSYIEMLQGFNSGIIVFADDAVTVRGKTGAEQAVRGWLTASAS